MPLRLRQITHLQNQFFEHLDHAYSPTDLARLFHEVANRVLHAKPALLGFWTKSGLFLSAYDQDLHLLEHEPTRPAHWAKIKNTLVEKRQPAAGLIPFTISIRPTQAPIQAFIQLSLPSSSFNQVVEDCVHHFAYSFANCLIASSVLALSKETEAKFKALFDNSSDLAIAISSSEGKIIEANPAMYRWLGYSPKELEGKPLAAISHPEDWHLNNTFFSKMLRGEQEGYSLVKRYFRKDGSLIWGKLNVSQVRDSQGAYRYTLGVVSDLTKIMETRHELETTFEELRSTNEEITRKNLLIESKNRDILASISYAHRMQSTLMPSREQLSTWLPKHVLYFRPKDIVSGDFYWAGQKYGKTVVVLGDCTGHGVPGAFMSILGIQLLEKLILFKGITEPEDVLSEMYYELQNSFRAMDPDSVDGMDLGVLAWDAAKGRVSFCGSKMNLAYFCGENLEWIKGDPHPLMLAGNSLKNPYKQVDLELQGQARFYLATDGLQDQFGGQESKKFSSKRVKALLESLGSLPLEKQEEAFQKSVEHWMGQQNQVDDITVFGFELEPAKSA